ncbi:hypothetical protein PR202_ga31535 [Eleusine coracana subsp. coracana]|uniref:PTC1-like winged helix-turn-helix domain-containing protein n=1 Tax=Eleusine coracana subsp. coracana TaxID=191504 RepID=A0AAV5DSP9_ELECO|nr:hypothetical protein PR202_ga31535 [Eleusine coracana subsp. coracana]
MAVIGRPPKRARVTAWPRPLDIRTFPCGGEGLEAGGGAGAFRDRVRAFLARCAVPSGGAWCVGLRVGEEDGKAATVAMEIVEEDVARAGAARVYCEHCTVAGWSKHPVCGKRYHFIIRNAYGLQDYKTCRHCGLIVQLFRTGCPSCKHGISYDDPEDWDYMQLDNPQHLLHGVVHENGFGHLVRINGREGGSGLLTGYEIMDFWDRLCKHLRVRSPRNQLQDTIAFYQSISMRPLTTIRELFLYILELANSKSVHNHSRSIHKKEVAYSHLQEAWSDEEIKHAIDIALKILCAVGTRWVAKRTLKAAISHSIGSPQLVDYCLKTLGSRSIDDMVIAVRCNSFTDKTIPVQKTCLPTWEHLVRDIKFLFEMLLHPHSIHPYKPVDIHEDAKRSAMILLDCKQFKKHYDLEEDFLPKKPILVVHLVPSGTARPSRRSAFHSSRAPNTFAKLQLWLI